MPKIVDHDKYKEKLLQGFFEIFARKGYENTTMREIAQETGISTGTLYHYFPTKKAILEQLFALASRIDSSQLTSRINDGDSVSVRLKKLIDFVGEKESYFQDIELLTIDYLRSQDSKETFQTLKAADEYYISTIANSLKLDKKYGFLVAIFLNGLVYHRLVFPDSVDYTEQGELFYEAMMAYLEKI